MSRQRFRTSKTKDQTAKVQGKLPFKYLESGGIKIMKVQRTIAKLIVKVIINSESIVRILGQNLVFLVAYPIDMCVQLIRQHQNAGNSKEK